MSLRNLVFAVALAAPLAVSSAWSQTAAPSAPAAAASRLDAVLHGGVLRVGTTGDYTPFTYQNQDSKGFEGIDIDMAQSLAKALGVKLELVKTSWKNLMPDLAADKFDIAMGGISVTLERQKQGLFSEPTDIDGKTPIARCADQAKYQTLGEIDRPGVRVIVNPGGTNERFAREHLKKAKIAVYPDNVTIFDQIAEGKADVMITDASETLWQHKLHPSLCSIHPDHPFDTFEKAYLLPRDFAWKAFVDQWLHQAKLTKAYAMITDKWLK